MNSKCLCGCCNKYLNNAPSTSSGKKDSQICPVSYIINDRHCTCPFCRLPSIAREPQFTNYLLYIMHQQIDIGENEFLKVKMINEIKSMAAKSKDAKKIQDEKGAEEKKNIKDKKKATKKINKKKK